MYPTLQDFRRFTAVEQTAQILTDAIQRGEITDFLPGEAALSAKLKVSRSTLRRALAILVRQDLLLVSHGKRTRVIRPKRKPSPKNAATSASVCFITYASPTSHLLKINILLDEVKAALDAEGITWGEIFKAQMGGRHLTSRLREIVAAHPKCRYVLLNSPHSVQQWFAQSGEPALVVGTRHEGVDLPFIDYDHQAIGWHVGGQFIKNGHKSVLFVIPDEPHAAGLLASEAGLRQYMSNTEGTQVQVLRASPHTFLRAFEQALSGAAAPTAALVYRIELILSVLGSAQRFGRSIPRDFSLVASEDHPFFEFISPSITRYRRNLQTMVHKILRLIHALPQGIAPAHKTTLVVPDFFPGQTLQPRA